MLEVLKNWRLSSAYSFFRFDVRNDPSLSYIGHSINNEGIIPRNQFKLRSQLNFLEKFELDNLLYMYDNITAKNSNKDVNSYVKFDSRLAYAINDKLKVAFIGQNLFDKRHQEFSAPLYSEISVMGRYVAFEISAKF